MISARNILRHELIGLVVSVVDASNPLHRGISGQIIDETRNTLLIRTPDGDRRIQKQYTRFCISIPDGTRVLIDGSAIVSSPEKRITQYAKIRGK
ncbi:MAG TPA: ribonuclease P protein subunit [Methanoregulaceae archaeon]|nr:ribonuclease P protein subunit [Methanoregulaceae archaeon]HNY88760.1 ribonuclease P protein subunit [Methanoregulaceae archaeon]HOB59744.1 ribonuclease P protein subunit [Methanoregulaceae archaeon]HOH80483.1 ribonuclease P protein subunit [Methanoregulaceae archaeon]HPM60913.1 ribonuclease P protein subunit [Methanoregulaceae archaeon]